MHTSKKFMWQESINIFITSLAMVLPLLILGSILFNKNLIYVSLLIWISVHVTDHIYRKLGGKGLNENEISE